jgi:chemotaxis protein methyltransferase CheR
MAFTYFFRDYQTLEMIRDHVLPVIGCRRFINIWSAGCAMGQEPYTIAIILRENMGPMIFRNVKIFATDIDTSNLFRKIIESGSYPWQELQRIPPELFSKYFSPDKEREGYCKISEDIRRRLIFERSDLLGLRPVHLNMGLIVCKNVLLHFTEEERIAVLRMFHDALDDGCFLIMEQTQKMPEEMEPYFEQVVCNAQLFRKRSPGCDA